MLSEPALVRGKTSKDKPGAYIPRMTFAKEHCDFCPQRSLDTILLQFDEEIDIGLAKRYAYSCPGSRPEHGQHEGVLQIDDASIQERTSHRGTGGSHADLSESPPKTGGPRKVSRKSAVHQTWKTTPCQEICGG